MATQIPVALKSADISRFAIRAAQLEKYKPIVSYWLEYYVLQQILTKSLHNESPEVSAYAAQLMDKLESTKQRYPDESGVTDDIAAQAYMEQFASETLARAEKAHHDDTVTKQTADTLQAAATFFESLSIWGELNTEVKTKIKFAKYHALRIVKALKNGQDPNATNPKPQADSAEVELEDELRQLEESGQNSARPLQPTVEDVSDGLPTVPSIVASHSAAESTTSPTSPAGRPTSIGGGYFPRAQDTFTAPSVDEEVRRQADSPVPSDEAALQQARQSAQSSSIVAPPQPTQADAVQFYNTGSASASAAPAPAPAPLPIPAAEIRSTVAQGTGLKTDDDAVMAAQKHAKWAISALNFEDVPTAVQELRKALESLGGL